MTAVFQDKALAEIAANKMNGVIEAIRATINKVPQATDDSAAGWKGEARGVFETVSADWHNDSVALNASLTEIQEALKKGTAVFDNMDDENKGKFGTAGPSVDTNYTNLKV
ncbi:WXG100 family type VII secretion target [Nocardia sp. CA-107356]|uniref:WXG100 family type VII secretion target n=1 Tax=Nocardia sp. CA-107356 TaxID=3239972 RepID=UPI003D8F6E81